MLEEVVDQHDAASRLVRRQLKLVEEVFERTDIGHHAARLFAVLAIRGILYSPIDGWQRISLKELMTITNGSRQTVINSSKKLESLALVEVEVRDHRNHFRVLLTSGEGGSNA